jgi:hypothetical protein
LCFRNQHIYFFAYSLHLSFPRTEENLTTFLGWKGGIVVCALAIDAPDEVLTKRLMGRGASSGRWDDKDAKVIAKRLENFHAQTVPVIKHYEVLFSLVRTVFVDFFHFAFFLLSRKAPWIVLMVPNLLRK